MHAEEVNTLFYKFSLWELMGGGFLMEKFEKLSLSLISVVLLFFPCYISTMSYNISDIQY